jgi:ATP-binding cassette subfamily G (WHITE) protein 2 (SNQ2)
MRGHIQYGAFTPKEIRQHYRGDVVYCPEEDVHFPTLTVGETISFAASTRAPHAQVRKGLADVGPPDKNWDIDVETMAEEDGPRASRKVYVDVLTQILTTVFGLRHAVNTKVGGAALRGVSGGEKKRVSIAETLASRAMIGAWDK